VFALVDDVAHGLGSVESDDWRECRSEGQGDDFIVIGHSNVLFPLEGVSLRLGLVLQINTDGLSQQSQDGYASGGFELQAEEADHLQNLLFCVGSFSKHDEMIFNILGVFIDELRAVSGGEVVEEWR
jgi:hypothetical protein